MSVLGIFSSGLFTSIAQTLQNKRQQFQQEFQQLGQDLQSGNLTAAQADLANLQKSGPQNNSTSSAQNINPINQEFSQLAKDLQSGNISAAQQDYTTIRQDYQNQVAPGQHHHHHHTGGESETSTFSQLLDQLGRALQSGNLSTAQQAYSTLQQDFQQFVQNSGLQTQAPSQSTSNSLSVIA
jgi:outer membrane protein assembly factor BamD (BamD/ComL family)